MAGGAAGDLDEMGDADHLPLLREFFKFFAKNGGGLASDVAVDLVEHETRRPFFFRENGFDGEKKPRKFSAAGALFERDGRRARIGGKKKADLIAAGGGHRF